MCLYVSFGVCARVLAHLLLKPAATGCLLYSPVHCGLRPPPHWPLHPTGAGDIHHICYTVQCLTSYNLFMAWPLTSHLSLNFLSYNITSTVSSGPCRMTCIYCAYIARHSPRVKTTPAMEHVKLRFNTLATSDGGYYMRVYVFPTCTTEMCPCRTAKVRAAQWRLSGCTEGCFGEHGGTWQHRTNQLHTKIKITQETMTFTLHSL